MKISGFTFIHNAVAHDYCIEASIRSMAGVCDEVVVLECESTDGTPEILERLRLEIPTIRIFSAPWAPASLNQERNIDWTMDLANMARELCSHPYVIYVQGDEVLHEKDFPMIRLLAERNAVFYVKRLNFWQRPDRLIPHGHCCGHWIVRMGPRETKVVFGSESMDPKRAEPSEVELFHYGFLREPKAFCRKAEIMLPNFIGCMDPRLRAVEEKGWKAFEPGWGPELSYTGTHPSFVREWLKARGYEDHR